MEKAGAVLHSTTGKAVYKMCLAVYANGVRSGAGTHVSVSVLSLFGGEYDDQLEWPMQCPWKRELHLIDKRNEPGCEKFYVCSCYRQYRWDPNENQLDL